MSLVEDTFREHEQKLNAVYRERDLCLAMVAHLAKDAGYQVGMRLHEADNEPWDEEWRHVLFIQLPTGQCSWHVKSDELEYFKNLGFFPEKWDKHTTEEKYDRVKDFCRNQYHNSPVLEITDDKEAINFMEWFKSLRG